MEWLISNWYLLVVGVATVVVGCLVIYKWACKPTAEQVANIKEWLLYAVIEAEKQLGGGTGQVKLRQVYDMAIQRFKWLSVIPFSTFSDWVDETLAEMKKMLAENKAVKNLVEGEQSWIQF